MTYDVLPEMPCQELVELMVESDCEAAREEKALAIQRSAWAVEG